MPTMPSFFTSKAPKFSTPIFAGLDEPFTFPTPKMRYTSRSRSRTSSPDSANDSGYCSSASFSDSSLSPKSRAPKPRRRLQKKDHQWGVQAHAEPRPELNTTGEKHTDTTWHTSPLPLHSLVPQNGIPITPLQRSMAPIIRRPPPGPRKKSTLLHPSPPPESSLPPSTHHTPPTPAARRRTPSTLLHPSPPLSPTLPPPTFHTRCFSPLGVQGPPLASHRRSSHNGGSARHVRKASVLHSCFSDSDSDEEGGEEGDEDEGGDGRAGVCAGEREEWFRRVARGGEGGGVARRGVVVRRRG